MLHERLAKLQTLRPPASEADIIAAESAFGLLPDDYKAFLRTSDGFEGLADPDHYLVLYPAADLIPFNVAYKVEPRKGLILFGGDGGGEGYFFDTMRPGPPVLMIAFISDWLKDAEAVGNSFTDFLAQQLGEP